MQSASSSRRKVSPQSFCSKQIIAISSRQIITGHLVRQTIIAMLLWQRATAILLQQIIQCWASPQQSPNFRKFALSVKKKNVAHFRIIALKDMDLRLRIYFLGDPQVHTEGLRKHHDRTKIKVQITSFCWLQNSLASHLCIAAYGCSNPATIKKGEGHRWWRLHEGQRLETCSRLERSWGIMEGTHGKDHESGK